MESNQLKKEVAEFAKLVWDRKLTDGTEGNMSIKNGEQIYITPTTTIKHFLTEKDIITINKNGRKRRTIFIIYKRG